MGDHTATPIVATWNAFFIAQLFTTQNLLSAVLPEVSARQWTMVHSLYSLLQLMSVGLPLVF